jgi:hypothetical protein
MRHKDEQKMKRREKELFFRIKTGMMSGKATYITKRTFPKESPFYMAVA